ncbi:MAG: AraC family transcriptional regulator [Balneola sp.]
MTLVEFIIENLYKESLNIQDANQACLIKSKNFSSKFKIYVGTTPKKFILEHRINVSKKLLIKRNLTIAEVSILVGFSSHSAFSKAFIRDSEGISPSIWQEKILIKNPDKHQAC